MIVYIFDSDFKKLGVLHKWTYMQYNDYFCGIGDFDMRVIVNNENAFLLDRTRRYYLSFDGEAMGYVQHVSRANDSEDVALLQVKGKLISYILDKRVISGVQAYSGRSSKIVCDIINANVGTKMVGSDVSYRFLNVNPKEKLVDASLLAIKSYQQTGGTIWGSIEELMASDELGYDVVPNESSLVEGQYGVNTNIYDFDLYIIQGHDRTKGNKQGNDPITFSYSLSNLASAEYEYDKTDESNICYVAGEGEGASRKWLVCDAKGQTNSGTGAAHTESTGWGREEFFVDARDLQKDAGEKTYTDSEYTELLRSRAMEKFSGHLAYESFDATIVQQDKRYQYGRDGNFYKGDYITIIDEVLGIAADVQVTGYTKTVEGNRVMHDVSFGYKRLTVGQKVKREGLI